MQGVNQIVTSLDEGVKASTGNVKKVDVEDEQTEKQKEVINAIAQNKELPKETVGESETETTDIPSEQKTEEVKKEDEEDTEEVKQEYDNGYIDVEEKKEEKIDKEKLKEEIKKEVEKEFMEKYKPNEQKSANIKLHKENVALKNQTSTENTDETSDYMQYLVTDKENQIYENFLSSNKDVIPEESAKALREFRQNNDITLIENDPILSKLNNELDGLTVKNSQNPLQDLPSRLDKAIKLAFGDKILDIRLKQKQAEMEINQQKMDAVVEPEKKSTTTNKETKTYSNATQKVAKQWGVELP